MADEEMIPEDRRIDILAACFKLVAQSNEAYVLTKGEFDGLALAALDSLRINALKTRNALGQWLDSVVCELCGKEGRNIVANRAGESPGTEDWPAPHHVIDIGFRCEHCGKEWGFEVLKDVQAT